MAKNFRSLFSKIFGSKEDTIAPKNATSMQFLSGYTPIFTNYNGSYYDDIDVRACVDAIARNAAKLNPKHQRYNNKQNNNDVKFINVNGYIQRLISVRPNELQNAFQFYYQVISELFLFNNSFIYVLRDEKDRILGLYPLHYQTIHFYEYKSEIWLQFRFGTGRTRFVALQDCIHLRRFLSQDGIMGGNDVPITATLSIKHVLNEGIINAIKTTQAIRGIIKTTKSMLKVEDVKKMRDNFVRDFIDSADSSGVGGLDATMDFTPVKLDPVQASDDEVKNIDKKILRYFGISEEIVQSKYSEDEWNAFYESVIEPIGLQLGLEFTNKLFSYTEIAHGNQIIFNSNRLQYASNATKINLLRYANNLMTVDELREVFNLEPLPDGKGQKIMQDLNHINGDIADKYQTGDDNSEGDDKGDKSRNKNDKK